MTRRDDFTLPWGREDPTIKALIRNEKEYKIHREAVKRQVAQVDTSDPPSRLELGDLFNRGKTVQIRRYVMWMFAVLFCARDHCASCMLSTQLS